MKLVTNFFFLFPFIYNFLLLVVQVQKEGKTEKRQECFQSQLLFSGLQLFCREECFSRTNKIAVLPVEVSIVI